MIDISNKNEPKTTKQICEPEKDCHEEKEFLLT